MKAVKRYDLEVTSNGDGETIDCLMAEKSDGVYVDYSDYYKLSTRVAELEDALKDIEVDDVIAWADGVASDLGTEYANRVTEKEAILSRAILESSVCCKHSFHYFGEQHQRRCNKCNVIEDKALAGTK